MSESPNWTPTHVAPAGGLDAWAVPDASSSDPTRLTGGLPLVVTATRGDWSQVQASNGWTGWVDARRLEPVVPDTGEAPRDRSEASADADPDAPALLEAAADACAELLGSFERGEIDEVQFQAAALEAGMVRTRNLVWLLDWEHGEWYRYDGFSLQALSALAEEGPSS